MYSIKIFDPTPWTVPMRLDGDRVQTEKRAAVPIEKQQSDLLANDRVEMFSLAVRTLDKRTRLVSEVPFPSHDVIERDIEGMRGRRRSRSMSTRR